MSNRPTTIETNNGVSYTLLTYNDTGGLVDADSTPTSGDFVVTIAGVVLPISVTVSKRAGTTGIYDVAFTPAAGSFAAGDSLSVIETVLIGGEPFVNSYTMTAREPMRGTDSAATTADLAGLATESTAGQLEQNQQGLLSILSSTIIPNQSAINDRVISVEETTDKLDTMLQSDGNGGFQYTADSLSLAPTGSGGGGGDSAATIYAYFVDGSRPDPFKADGFATSSDITTQTSALESRLDSVDADNAAIKAVVDATSTDVSNIPGEITTQTSTLESRLDSVDADNAAIKTVVDATSTTVGGLPGEITTQTTTLESRFDDVDTDNAAIKNVVDATSTAVNGIASTTTGVKATTDKLESTVQSDGSGGYQFTVGALELAPTGSGGGGGDNAATIYAYFVDGSRPDPFKAAGFVTPSDITSQTTTLESRFDDVDADNAAIKNVVDATSTNVSNIPGSITAQTNALESRFDDVDADNAAIKNVVDATSTTVTATSTVVDTIATTTSGLASTTSDMKTTTDKLDTMVQINGSVYQYTADSLSLAPTGSGGGGGDSAATIYEYFIDGTRPDPFRADVQPVALEQTLTNGINQIITTGNANWSGGGSGGGGSVTVNATPTPRAF